MEFVDKLESLKMKLTSKSIQELLYVLPLIDVEIAPVLFDSLAALTNHSNIDVRVAALRALRFVDQSCLIDIIREKIRDENYEVRRAATELFHLKDLAA